MAADERADAPHGAAGAAAADRVLPSAGVREGCEQRLAEVSLTKGRLTEADLEPFKELAAAAAADGTALRTLVGDCLDSVSRNWGDLPGTDQAQDREALEQVVSALVWAVGDMTVALTEGYETAHRAAIRGEEAARREFVDDLLEGRTDLGRLAERAERFGLRLLGPHVVTVARAPDGFGAGDAATRYIEEALTARFSAHDVLITTKDGLLVCVAPGATAEVSPFLAAKVRDAVGDKHRIAISRPRLGPSGIVRSYQEALSALDLAATLGLSAQVVSASDVLVFQVLGRDRAAITDLVATVLGGLAGARGGPQTLLDTLSAYFASGCLNTTTARLLGLSVRAVSYRLRRIRELTGHDPTDPEQRYVLQTAALGARLLGWPSTPLQPAD
ncbi:PucR family transcriptional regulator [Streptomyces sp. NPDC093600]|uniref:PucR family transcriptional regulator n=1 Tax=Streptomyces sp. NPDC093600 TaxID=3366047 RepID=UPI0037FE812B